MRIFKTIIYKDFIASGEYNYIGYFITLLFVTVLIFFGNLPFFHFFLLFFIYMEIPCGTLWADDTQGWTKYSQSFMMSRKSIVNCRYVNLLVNWLFGITITELCSVAGHLMRGEQAVDLYNLAMLSVSVFIMCIISVACSLMFFGHKFISLGVVSLSAGFIGGYYGEIGDLKSFSMQAFYKIDDDLKFIFQTGFHVKLIAVCAVITAAVWVFTLVQYQRRDF